MKILAVADTVTSELLDCVGGAPPLLGVECILGCGDLPPEYLTRLRQRYDVPLYYILGNHDLRYRQSPPAGCQLIDRKLIRHGPWRLIGFSGSRWYNGEINQYTEAQMRRFLRHLRFRLWRSGGVDLVISHAPPRFIHDAEDPCHRGFRCFNTIIERYRPRYFIHGHIHALFSADDERITRVGTTTVINSYGYHLLETRSP